MSTGISPKWAELSEMVLLVEDGKHCHWCKNMVADNNGAVLCGKEGCQFSDGERIRVWDGLACADECGHFDLDEWYSKDENYDTIVEQVKETA